MINNLGKNISKIFIILLFLAGIFITSYSLEAYVSLPNGAEKIADISIGTNTTGDLEQDVNSLGFSLLKITKIVLQGLLIIYLVYVGIMMIVSMGSDEEQLSSAKRQLWYSIVAIIFINIPGTLYEAFHSDYANINTVTTGGFTSNGSSNIFVNIFSLGYTFDDKIIGFFKIMIFAAAIVMIILAGLQILTSSGKEESVSKGKNKILYSILALIFLSVLEAWKYFAFNGSVEEGINIFDTLANLALFFAGPIAIFFLTFAGYYYITANGDEEKVKKAKTIVINTVLATIILLAAYTFLLDLATL